MIIRIFNDDCLNTKNRIEDESVDLGIFDPPFGLGEATFNKHYKRDASHVLDGYVEAPEDYGEWTSRWIQEARRVLKPNGSMYVIMGHTHLRHLLNAAYYHGLHEVNHVIWKYSFGTYATKKFVTSHYHVLYYSKSKNSKRTFNTNCRFGSHEKSDDGKSLIYRDLEDVMSDLEDVFNIPRKMQQGKTKNQNKLPDDLIKKIIMYSSNPGDMVCDFFMGNFTTAYCALNLGRNVCGYEINPVAYDHHMPIIKEIPFGGELDKLKVVENKKPTKQGAPWTQQEKLLVWNDYNVLLNRGMKKKFISEELQEKYGRGFFAIKNVIDEMKDLGQEPYIDFSPIEFLTIPPIEE